MNSRNVKLFRENEEKLKQALLLLLELKDSSQISVMELCQIAKINRSTFYNHYEDIYALIISIEKNMQTPLVEFLEKNIDSNDFNQLCLDKILIHVTKYKSFFKAYFTKTSGTAFKECTKLLWFKMLMNRDNMSKDEIQNICNDKSYINKLNYFRGGINEIIKLWLLDDCKEPYSTIRTDIMNGIMP